MNRSPLSWSNPRALQETMNLRRMKNRKDRFLSFANIALSERISESPLRFCSSGRQCYHDIDNLLDAIGAGKHTLFHSDVSIDFFSYSIGSFLSQIIFMANDKILTSEAKLFMFCGGSIFSSMFGKSRSIMDNDAFERLVDYYMNHFTTDAQPSILKDALYESFCGMLRPDFQEQERSAFYQQMDNRVSGISLQNDTVIPFTGVAHALGKNFADSHIKQLDFEFHYSHENPFPVFTDHRSELVDTAFNSVFREISAFY